MQSRLVGMSAHSAENIWFGERNWLGVNGTIGEPPFEAVAHLQLWPKTISEQIQRDNSDELHLRDGGAVAKRTSSSWRARV